MATGNQIHVEGDVSGQIVIGNNNLVIQNHGDIVYVVESSSRSPFKKRPGPIRYIPRPFPALLDRVAQSQTVQGSLQNAVPVEVFGENGIGKTTFLSHMAHLPETNQYSDGVLYLYVKEQGLQDLIQLLFDSFYSSPGNVMPTAGQLRHHLQDIRAVILLDDLSLSREDTQALIAMLPVSCFIISSLERNLWGNGNVVPLGGLPEQEQFELFVREIKHPLSDAEKTDVASICRLLNGHPLKIIQAASLVTTSGKTVSEIRRQLDGGQRQLRIDQELIDSLNDVQKKALALLGASGGTLIPIAIIRSLLKLPDVQSILKGLVAMGLAWSQGSEYGIVGSLAGGIKSLWDLSAWENALIAHLSNWAESSPGDSAIEEASDLLVKVIQKAGEKNRWNEVLRLGRTLQRILILRKRWQVWLDTLNWILKAAKTLGDRNTEAWALHQLGTRALCLNYADQARQLLTQALNIRRAIGDTAGMEVTQHNLNVLRGGSVPLIRTPVDNGFWRYIAYGVGGMGVLGVVFLIVLLFLLNRHQSPPPTQVPVLPQNSPFATVTPSITPLVFVTTETNPPVFDFTFTPSTTPTSTSTYTLTSSFTPSITPSLIPPTKTSTITIIPTTAKPQQPQVCSIENYSPSIPYSQYTYIPPRQGFGDADFAGHGPNVIVKATVVNVDSRKFNLEIYMKAVEDRSDFTRAEGTKVISNFIVLPVGYVYFSYIGTSSNQASYKDTDHSPDTINPAFSGPAKKFVVVGDTAGDEAGTKTKVTVYFDTIRLRVYRTINGCIPPTKSPVE